MTRVHVRVAFVGAIVMSTVVVGCSSSGLSPTRTIASSSASVSLTTSPSGTMSGTPAPSAVAASALAVVEAASFNAGTYTVSLVTAQGDVVATATGTTPSDYVASSQPALTSTSDSRVYYEDGNSDIDYLMPSGQHGLAFTVTRPAGAAIGFAVSPDDSRVAVAVLTNFNGQSEPPSSTSRMYLMAIGGGTQLTLFDGNSGSSTHPLTWPVGWDGSDLVVGQSLPAFFYGLHSQDPCSGWGERCASQLSEFDPARKVFGQPLCAGDEQHLSGVPTASGIACEVTDGTTHGPGSELLVSYSWTGVRTTFASGLTLWDNGGCLLSPDGTLIACPSVIDNPQSAPIDHPARIYDSDGSQVPVADPAEAQFLGWIDANDVVVTTGIESDGLAVENLSTGHETSFSLPRGSDPWIWQFDGVIPGAL
jgi:hypothetical protein